MNGITISRISDGTEQRNKHEAAIRQEYSLVRGSDLTFLQDTAKKIQDDGRGGVHSLKEYRRHTGLKRAAGNDKIRAYAGTLFHVLPTLSHVIPNGVRNLTPWTNDSLPYDRLSHGPKDTLTYGQIPREVLPNFWSTRSESPTFY
ncbi:MAG: hypothetical protein KY468_18380, partial [Armatimonadetes bacterium]|nr:hypothetical protein [Armatimonadota bacterium]